MRFSRALTTFLCLSTIGVTNSGFAQKQQSPKQQVNQRFVQNAPKTGEVLPDVSGYDSEGNKINLRDLRGNYSILVFGCLT